jgi:GT2 family glycosyltransferase
MAPFVLLLNGDTWLESEALHRLVEHLRSRPRCALAGPRLSNPDGSYQASRFPALTPLNLLILNTNLCRLARFVPVLRRRFRALWSPDPGIEADWIKGAALIVRRDAFTAVGGFDESFFLYSEETDLCHRLRAAGWEIDWVPQAVVVHAEAASTGQAPEGMIVEKFASLGRFYRRHWPQRLPQLRRAIWVITAEWIARDRLKLLLPFGAERRRRVAGRLATWGRIRRLDWQSSSSQESPRATPR